MSMMQEEGLSLRSPRNEVRRDNEVRSFPSTSEVYKLIPILEPSQESVLTEETQQKHNNIKINITVAREYYKKEQYNKAEGLYKQCLNEMCLLFGYKHGSSLVIASELAICYTALNKLTLAKEIHEFCLATRKEVLGNHHPLTVRSLANLAQVMYYYIMS